MNDVVFILIGVAAVSALGLLWQWWMRRKRASWERFLGRVAPFVEARMEYERNTRTIALSLTHAGQAARLAFRDVKRLMLVGVLAGDVDPTLPSFDTFFDWSLPGPRPQFWLRVRRVGPR
jgi:hypothetical protein